MQVILFQNIERLGMQGDVVNVANGYFRNFLGPRGLAVAATEATLKRLELKRKKMRAEAERQLGEAEAVAKQIATVELKFTRKATDGQKLFGSVTDHEIMEALAEKGFKIERRQLVLAEPIKTTGTHHLKIRLHSHIASDLKVVVEPEAAPAAEAPKAAE